MTEPNLISVSKYGAGGFDPFNDGDELGARIEALRRVLLWQVGTGPYPDKPELWARYRQFAYFADTDAAARQMSVGQSGCGITVKAAGVQIGWGYPAFLEPYAQHSGQVFDQLQGFAHQNNAWVHLQALHSFNDHREAIEGWPNLGDHVFIGNDDWSPAWVRGGAKGWAHVFTIIDVDLPTPEEPHLVVWVVEGGKPGIENGSYWITRSKDDELWAGSMSCYGQVDSRGVPIKGKRLYGYSHFDRLPCTRSGLIPDSLPNTSG